MMDRKEIPFLKYSVIHEVEYRWVMYLVYMYFKTVNKCVSGKLNDNFVTHCRKLFKESLQLQSKDYSVWNKPNIKPESRYPWQSKMKTPACRTSHESMGWKGPPNILDLGRTKEPTTPLWSRQTDTHTQRQTDATENVTSSANGGGNKTQILTESLVFRFFSSTTK